MRRLLMTIGEKIWVVLLLGGIAAAMMVALLLTVGTTKPAHAGAFPGRNGKIAFQIDQARHRSGGYEYEIYSMDPNGANPHNLTRSSGFDDSPSYSANGKKIAFATDRDGNFEIYQMNSNGTLQTRLTKRHAVDGDPSYSPDGKKIAFSCAFGFNVYELCTINSNGTGLKRLTNNSVGEGVPAWSPDSAHIAFGRHRQVFVMRSDGTHQRKLTSKGINSEPTWSPSGKKIAFSHWQKSSTNPSISKMNSDGTNKIELTKGPARDYAPAYSPDGKKIAFVRDGDIYKMNSDGTNKIKLTDTPEASETQPSWQPLH